MDEFELIASVFAPLAAGTPGAFGLTDDVALVVPEPGQAWVMTVDAVIEGVHFLATDPADLVARKALRVNLSDLAAKGARPHGYLLTLMAPKPLDETRIRGLAKGLAADQEEFGIGLLGGDTVSTPGPLGLSITAMGIVPKDEMVRRSGAKPGDLLAVSGQLGMAALGLRFAKGEGAALSDGDKAPFVGRFLLPEPRLTLGQAIRPLVSASLDVSDGILGDAGHIAETSAVRVVIEAATLPQHPAFDEAVESLGGDPLSLLCGGDDYELLFAFSPDRLGDIEAASKEAGTPVTVIGRVENGRGVRLIDENGQEISQKSLGYRHF